MARLSEGLTVSLTPREDVKFSIFDNLQKFYFCLNEAFSNIVSKFFSRFTPYELKSYEKLNTGSEIPLELPLFAPT